ncbi:MAG: hypothetical protein JXA37_11385 [Chloroflexia bacterium]|nr:hypothetical protein [Chloroflexia bacterium]
MPDLTQQCCQAAQNALDILRRLHPREKCRACTADSFCYLHGVVLPDLAAASRPQPLMSPPAGPEPYADEWALRELEASLADAAECGDLVGHLLSWWNVVTGKTQGGDLVVPLKGAFDEAL